MDFLASGFLHVLPSGYDHVLFILCIFLSSSRWKTVLLRCTWFTLAHSLTLALVATGTVVSSPAWIEPLIAFSILASALENIYWNTPGFLKNSLVFLFGLVHGMGFAAALGDAGLPQEEIASALLSFNVGVEFGQLAVIACAWLLLGWPFASRPWYQVRVVEPLSVVIACIAAYWTITRLAG